MELRVLRYFLAVAREGKITAAAEKLHITQPTLSKQLMELEDELGKKLFDRGKRKITLTEEGLFLQKRAQEIVELADKTERDFRMQDNMVGGDILIGGGETDAMRHVGKTLERLRKQYPNIHFHLYSGNGEDAAEKLDKGLIDFALFVGTTELKKYEYLPLPNVVTWGILMRKDHPLASRPGISPKELEAVPLLCSRQSLIQNELAGWLGHSLENLHIIGTYNLIYNAALLVEEGLGCALAIDGLVNTSGNSRLCFRPLEPQMTAGVVIAWKNHQAFSKAAEKFLEALYQEIAGDSF
ncbi:MAG TPA: LysR family transcriptional regulator [Candidatus Gallacutalibacter pullistercoris]|nr:LysR family transcriptional regulator [Candidatus Gallacutalibacter pullistercoris]